MYTKMPWPPTSTTAAPVAQQAVSPANVNMMGAFPQTLPANLPTAMPAVPATMPAMPTAFPATTASPPVNTGGFITQSGAIVPVPREESYVENILRMNLGKVATLYMTYENNSEWNAKIFKGVLEAAGRDHIIISDPVTGKRYLLLTLNLDYITFDEPLNYTLPFGTQAQATRR